MNVKIVQKDTQKNTDSFVRGIACLPTKSSCVVAMAIISCRDEIVSRRAVVKFLRCEGRKTKRKWWLPRKKYYDDGANKEPKKELGELK